MEAVSQVKNSVDPWTLDVGSYAYLHKCRTEKRDGFNHPWILGLILICIDAQDGFDSIIY